MAPTPYLWQLDGGTLRITRRGRTRAECDARQIRRRHGWSGWQYCQSADCEAVRAYLGENWLERGVVLDTAAGPWLVVCHREWASQLDPTYDGIDLLGDAGWTIDLAQAIAALTGLPLRIDVDLA